MDPFIRAQLVKFSIQSYVSITQISITRNDDVELGLIK